MGNEANLGRREVRGQLRHVEQGQNKILVRWGRQAKLGRCSEGNGLRYSSTGYWIVVSGLVDDSISLAAVFLLGLLTLENGDWEFGEIEFVTSIFDGMCWVVCNPYRLLIQCNA